MRSANIAPLAPDKSNLWTKIMHEFITVFDYSPRRRNWIHGIAMVSVQALAVSLWVYTAPKILALKRPQDHQFFFFTPINRPSSHNSTSFRDIKRMELSQAQCTPFTPSFSGKQRTALFKKINQRKSQIGHKTDKFSFFFLTSIFSDSSRITAS